MTIRCPRCLTGSLFEAIDEDRGPHRHCFACGHDVWAEPTLDPKPQHPHWGPTARTITSTCPGCGCTFEQKATGRRIYCGPACRYKFGNYHHGKSWVGADVAEREGRTG